MPRGRGRHEAGEHFERALHLYRELGFRHGEAMATGNLGIVCASQGRIEEARAHYERGVVLCAELGYRLGEAIARYNLAIVLRSSGELDLAERSFVACARICEQLDHRHLAAATQQELGALLVSRGDVERGRAVLRQAAASGFGGIATVALCELACLPGGDADAALAAFGEHAEGMDASDRREALWLLWRATGDPSHLDEAGRLLDESLSRVPAEYRDAMRTRVRANREIDAARARAPRGDDTAGGESATRVG